MALAPSYLQPRVGYTASSPTIPVGTSYNASNGAYLKASPVINNNTSTGGGAVQQVQSQPQPQQSQPSYDPYANLRNDISTAWDSYLGSLNDVGNTYLPQQQTAQQGIINSQYDQGVNTVNTQKAKSLRDIATNARNAFQAGNNFLGAHGAGDSSAADQYSFAVNQDANKQTGNLNEFVNGQLSNLGSQRDQQLLGVANWFAQSQAAIKQQVAQGNLSKSQDINNLSKNILDQALAASNQIKANATNQYNALLSWATNNSKSLGDLQTNIAGIPQVMGQIQVDSTGNAQIPAGYGYANAQKKDIFGNPVGA